MTISGLIKRLERLKNKHGGSCHIAIDLTEAKVNQSIVRDHSHWSAGDVRFEVIRWAKDGNHELADGSERMKRIVSIGL